MTKPFLLGVLGGMGPLATLDFQRRLLDATPGAERSAADPFGGVERPADRGPGQKGAGGNGPRRAAAYSGY